MTVSVDISAWKPAPFALKGETVFAVGDVHGCATELRALLDAIANLARAVSGPRRLIYLGDMINRGSDSIGVLELWAEKAETRGVDRIDRVMGNHEIMMMLAVIGGPHTHKAKAMWLSKRMGGQKLLDQMVRGQAGRQCRLTRRCSRRHWATVLSCGFMACVRTSVSATRCSSMADSIRTRIPTNS